MKLRICLITPTLVQGGAEKQLTLLASYLDPDQFDVHVIVLTHTGPYEQQLIERGVRVHLIGKRWKADPTAFFRLRQKIEQIAPHVVHTWLFAANSYGRLAASLAKVPVIIAGERCVDPWKSWWHHRVDKWLLRHTTSLATNTNAVVDFYTRKGIPAELFRVIPNAITASPVAIDKATLFQRLGLQPRKYVVGAIGRLWPQKGYPDLVWASELLRVVLKDVWFIVVGDGPELARLQELRDRYGAQDVCRFAGHRQDARELLSAFDLLWNGSLYEGQSNTILEAMSAGVPVVAADIPGNRDLVVSGETGYLYRPADVGQLARYSNQLLSDPQLHSQFASRSRRRAEESFSLELMVQRHAQLYRELFERSQSHVD